MGFPTPDIQTYTIVTGGGTDSIDLTNPHELYIINGTGVTLSSSYTVNTIGSAQAGIVLELLYIATVTLNSNTVTILGRLLTSDEATSPLNIIASYNGSSWDVVVSKSNSSGSVGGSLLVDITAGGTLTLTPGITPTNLILYSPGGTLATNFSINPIAGPDGSTFNIIYQGGLASTGGNSLNFGAFQLTESQALGGGELVTCIYNLATTSWYITVTRPTFPLIETDECSTNTNTYSVNLEVDFATPGFVYRIYPYTKFEITTVNYIVTKTLSGTDNGHIIFDISGVPTVPDTITIPLSTVEGVTGTLNITSTNTGTSANYIDILTNKVTPNGKVFLSIKLTKK